MKLITTLVFSFFLIGCINTHKANNVLPKQPEKVKSSIDKIELVDKHVNTIKETNNKISQNVKNKDEIISKQKQEIEEALKQAEDFKNKIKANEVVTELESLNLVSQIEKIKERNMFLEIGNKEISDLIETNKQDLQTIEQELEESKKLIIAKDSEVEQLRNNYDHASNILNDKNEEIKNLEKSLKEETKKSERYKVYRNWVIGILTILVLWFVINKLIKYYSPFSKIKL